MKTKFRVWFDEYGWKVQYKSGSFAAWHDVKAKVAFVTYDCIYYKTRNEAKTVCEGLRNGVMPNS